MLASSGARPTMHRIKDRWTELFILSLSLCCSLGQEVIIQFQSVSSSTITEGGGLIRNVCLVSSALASNDISFSLSVSPGTSELALPTNPFIPQGRACETVTITSMNNNVRQDTRTFQISLSSSTADVHQNQSQFLINIQDNDIIPGGTVPMCPTPTVINSSPVSCNSFSSGSTCTYRCNNGFVRLSGADSRTCTNFFRWSGNPLFCIPMIDSEPPVVDCSNVIFVMTAPAGASGVTIMDLPRCSATDDSGQADFVSWSPSSGFFPLGDTLVTVTYGDSSGNTGTGSFTVTVLADVIITCPTDGVGVLQTGTIIGVWSDPVCTGGVPPFSTSCTPQSRSVIDVGDTQVTCTCTDTKGTTKQCSFIVSVDDDPPIISNCPATIVVNIHAGQTQGDATWTEPTASDVSGTTLVSRSHFPGDSFPVRSTPVTYEFRDGFNNMATCAFIVVVYTVAIDCPPSITIPYGNQLSYVTPQCTRNSGFASQALQSTCIPQSGRITEDVTAICRCNSAAQITCNFQVTVITSIQCPPSMTISPGEMLSYDTPQCMSSQGSSTASCLPPLTGSPVTLDTSFTCSCPPDGSVQCSFQIFVDCLAVLNSFCGNPGVSCDCMNESCDQNTGICSRHCTVANTCPASIESKSLSRVNPSSSVDINCTLKGSTTILDNLQVRLSINLDDNAANAIPPRNRDNTGDKVVLTFRVENVSEEQKLFCVLMQGNHLIGGVNVINFVYELPVLNAAPISDDVSNTSITIIWRAWDATMDDGDPPIVAYIPYYRMDGSDVWISGPRILSSETLQFKADNLEVDTLYEFSVAAVREGGNGEGRRSPVVSLKTYCNVPDVAVSVNVQLTSSNKLNVSWQIPPVEIMCSTGVTSYKVYYRIEGSTDDTPQLAGTVEDVDERYFIVDDGLLEPGTAYIFFVTVITDQESGFRESEAIEAPAAGTSALVFLISLIVISVILIGIIVVFIKIRYRRKSSSKDKKTVKVDDDGVGTDYVNAAIADDPEDYIPLEEQSRTVSSSKYEDLNLKPHGGASIPAQYEVTIVPQTQKPVETPRYQIRNMKGVNSGAYEDVGAGSVNRQLPDVPQSHSASDNEDEEHGYVVPDRLEEYTGVYINIKNNKKLVHPGPIKVAEFQVFMSRNKEDVVNDIVQQFMALPSGPQYPWSDALKFQNKPRNFFKTILAYDHSRVKLDTYGSDARSDYINASYIKNQQGKTPFIAAQGPQEGTVDDFWKMVWQENVETIVMVTDNIEKNKLLCCNYWPKKVHMSEMFDDITVLLMESTSYTTHTIRKLNLLKGNQKAEVHTVTQVHVHSWQYGSVPKDPVSLISIIKKVKSLQTDGSSSPLLVHCSNGVGATGTFIAVYVLMDTVKKNKDVNIFDFVKRMREDRVDMVQTRIQYLFIFECLLAVLKSTGSQISCDQLKKLGQAALKLKSKKEYKILQESAIQKQHSEDYTGNSPENQHKNRFKNLIPVDKFRPVLESKGSTFGFTSYINAVHLTDFSGRQFIMTQTPLPSTVEDFWRLVYDYECTTIVMLNNADGSDETVIQYWPGGAHGSAQYGLMKVVCTSTTNRESCMQSQFQVAHKKVAEKSVSVDHFAFCGWSGNQPDVSRLRQFIRITGNKRTGPVLVHCINGVGLSSVYVIAKTESERLEQEGSIDVFQCLTKLRKICPHAIQTQEEYTLCYQLLKDHLDNPEEYAVVY